MAFTVRRTADCKKYSTRTRTISIRHCKRKPNFGNTQSQAQAGTEGLSVKDGCPDHIDVSLAATDAVNPSCAVAPRSRAPSGPTDWVILHNLVKRFLLFFSSPTFVANQKNPSCTDSSLSHRASSILAAAIRRHLHTYNVAHRFVMQ